MSDFRITPRHVENSRGWERLGTNSSLDWIEFYSADSKEHFTMALIFSDPLDPDLPKGLIKSSFNSGR